MGRLVTFLQKHYELWPLHVCLSIAFGGGAAFCVWSLLKKDYIIVHNTSVLPWDKLDLLRHPYSRKLSHNDYEVLKDMDKLYKDMDKKERERARVRPKTESNEC